MTTPDSAAATPRVRPMEARDRDAIVELLSTSDPWLTLGFTRADWLAAFDPVLLDREVYVADVGGLAAGIAVVRPSYMLGDYLNLLAVAAGERGRGLGRLLIEHVEQVAFARAKNLFICVSDFNRAARAFYARLGYEEVGVLRDLIVAGRSEILLRKTIGPFRQ
jgi:ribosomal-protein-alanine N-acetyltransferase